MHETNEAAQQGTGAAAPTVPGNVSPRARLSVGR
jgi:hypothetical protein